MKVAIPGVAAADLDATTITVEGTVRNVRDLLGLMRNASIVSDGTNFTWYLDAPFDIQAATKEGTTAVTPIVIENNDEVEIRNLAATTVTRFNKGKSYLIANATAAVTTIIPSPKTVVAVTNAGNDSAVHCAARYLFVAEEDSVPLNATSIDCIVFDFDWAAWGRNQQKRQLRKQMGAQSYQSAMNH